LLPQTPHARTHQWPANPFRIFPSRYEMQATIDNDLVGETHQSPGVDAFRETATACADDQLLVEPRQCRPRNRVRASARRDHLDLVGIYVPSPSSAHATSLAGRSWIRCKSVNPSPLPQTVGRLSWPADLLLFLASALGKDRENGGKSGCVSLPLCRSAAAAPLSAAAAS